MAKRHKGTPVHSMADEPAITLESIVVDTSEAEGKAVGAALLAEVEREYDLDVTEEDREVARAMVEKAEEHAELTGTAQDEQIDAMEELKEMAEATNKGPKVCPTCRRPIIEPQMNKAGEETKSSRIRRMAAAGMAKGAIAKELEISYQFVHNVLSRPSKTG